LTVGAGGGWHEKGRAAARLFALERDTDVSGVSGVGTVADGVLWPDGTVTIRWRGERPSTVNWAELAHAEAVHGHDGATRIVFAEAEDEQRVRDYYAARIEYLAALNPHKDPGWIAGMQGAAQHVRHEPAYLAPPGAIDGEAKRG